MTAHLLPENSSGRSVIIKTIKMIRFLFIGSVLLLLDASFASISGANPKLALVHIIHRHGDRTPDQLTYPNDPYINDTYYPDGRGALTNNGKLRMYNLGEWLRARYDNFLGPIYTPQVIESRSSAPDRAKMSTQLVQAGLYPPAPIQRWNCKLNWQPIPYIYSPMRADILLYPQLCSSSYTAESNRVRNTTEVRKIIAQYAEQMDLIGKLTGITVNSTGDVFLLYYSFEPQIAADMPQPIWLPDIYEAIKNITILDAELNMSYNNILKRKYGGTLLRKIIDDTRSYANGTLLEGRKLFNYLGHATNILSLQMTLGVFKPHLPAYSSAQMIEIWELNGELWVKLIYYTGISKRIVPQKLPGCDELCPFEKFVEQLAPVTATDEDMMCAM